MKKTINLSLIITILFLFVAVIISSIQSNELLYQSTIASSNRFTATKDEIKTQEEMRGMWVSYISLDMRTSDMSFETFKTKFDSIIDKAKFLKCNTLIVHVRPFCDALYSSDIYPYSHILSGTQGKNPGYDALEYMCDAAHQSGLKIHGWINPYRVKGKTTDPQLSERSPAIAEDGLTINLESGIYLNPAKKGVRNLITDGIKEIINNYEIDGIQFDDYFYPTDIKDSDSADYNAYIKSLESKATPMSLEEWRRNNVNLLIAESYKAIKDSGKDVVFGISPQGNIKNNENIYADVINWCKTYGYVDYICPQLYYSLESPALSFEDALKQWKELSYHSNIKVYIGLALYKAGSNDDDGTWLQRNDILAKELKLLREYGYNGYILYDYNSLLKENTNEEINNLLKVVNDNT